MSWSIESLKKYANENKIPIFLVSWQRKVDSLSIKCYDKAGVKNASW